MSEALSLAINRVDGLIRDLNSSNVEDLSYERHTSTSVPSQDARKTGRAKPAKAAKVQSTQPSDGDESNLEMFAKAKLAIGLVRQVDEIANSDKLYRCQVQVAEGQNRQIVAGLRKHISKEDLLGRSVVVILNMKAAKLAGEASEGMILAAVQKGEQYEHGELVRPLTAPAGAQIGDLVFLEGSAEKECLYPKECKQWKKLLPFLAVQSSAATFRGKRLSCATGIITADASLPDGASVS